MGREQQPRSGTDELLAARAARSLTAVRGEAPASEPATSDDVTIHTDPVGAANLMREVVARGTFDAALEEDDGHWHVVVRGGSDATVLVPVVDLVARCIDDGLVDSATLCVGARTYTMAPFRSYGREAEHAPAAA